MLMQFIVTIDIVTHRYILPLFWFDIKRIVIYERKWSILDYSHAGLQVAFVRIPVLVFLEY